MDFSAFDSTEMDRYAADAKARWGQTGAYKEFEQKTAGQTPAQMRDTGNALMDIFAWFDAIRHTDPASGEAQALVARLQGFIAEHYYIVFGSINEELVSRGMVAQPQYIPGEGRYFKCIEVY